MLVYDNLASNRFQWISTAQQQNEKKSRISLPEADPENDPYWAEVLHFLGCVRQGRKPAISWEDALRSCELAFSAIESSCSGQPVQVAARE